MCGGENEKDKARAAQYSPEQMNDPNFKGVPMDAGLLEFSENKAPFSDRHCTDVFCCIVFVVFIVYCTGLAINGIASGDPLAFFYLYDEDGRACGTKGTWGGIRAKGSWTGYSDIAAGDTYDTTNYPFLYIWLPLPMTFAKASCMSSCKTFTEDIVESNSLLDDTSAPTYFTKLAEEASKYGPTNQLGALTSSVTSPIKQLPCYPTGRKGKSPTAHKGAQGDVATANDAAESMCIAKGIDLWAYKNAAFGTPTSGNVALSLTGSYTDHRLIYPSKAYLGRLCFPQSPCMMLSEKYGYSCTNNEWGFVGTTNIDLIWEKITIITEALGFVADLISDLTEAKWYIIGTIFLSMAIGFLFMVIMQLLAACLIWTFILTIIVGWSVLTGMVYMKKGDQVTEWDNQDATYAKQGSSAKADRSMNNWEWGFYPMAVVAVVLWIALCCFYKKIVLIIRIIQTAADFVTDVWTVTLIPVMALVMFVMWTLVGGISFMYIFTVGKVGQAVDPTDPSKYLPYTSIERTQDEQINVAVFFFLILWMAYFIDALNQFCIASTAAIWYFSDKDPHNLKKKQVNKPVSKSWYRAFRYHPGTMAFGSFLLAVVKMLQIIMNYVERQIASKGEMNKVKKAIINCLKCCLKCLERFIKFLNKNAYIQCAITSNNFCVSAKDAFFLIIRNPVIFALAGGLGKVFMTLGKWFITLGSTGAMYYALKEEYYDKATKDFDTSRLSQPYFVIFIIFVLSQLIGTMFMEVWGMAVDTILQCYCLDADIQKGGNQDGSPVFSKYTPVRLQAFINSPDMQSKEKAKTDAPPA